MKLRIINVHSIESVKGVPGWQITYFIGPKLKQDSRYFYTQDGFLSWFSKMFDGLSKQCSPFEIINEVDELPPFIVDILEYKKLQYV